VSYAANKWSGAITTCGKENLNNALCFPGLFRGALNARANAITPAMRQAATTAITECVSPEEMEMGVVIPSMFQRAVHKRVADAVAGAWLVDPRSAGSGPV